MVVTICKYLLRCLQLCDFCLSLICNVSLKIMQNFSVVAKSYVKRGQDFETALYSSTYLLFYSMLSATLKSLKLYDIVVETSHQKSWSKMSAIGTISIFFVISDS